MPVVNKTLHLTERLKDSLKLQFSELEVTQLPVNIKVPELSSANPSEMSATNIYVGKSNNRIILIGRLHESGVHDIGGISIEDLSTAELLALEQGYKDKVDTMKVIKNPMTALEGRRRAELEKIHLWLTTESAADPKTISPRDGLKPSRALPTKETGAICRPD